ncbi:hypothetical protein JOF56_003204 [Kibdelosporangium banguiense]|uniref:Tachylectin 2 domain-containing protein n=1 Tax=Kibdelosporangium banguiense TaxID=1365924 RepID=A0ABS4TEN7_9PSEU|nr:tachylectin-related carbohydrate-binding protein [Kibdelosporangium banguiense]MBP2322819.1 hypothetical protein [Kibdelosporangium banguiense]
MPVFVATTTGELSLLQHEEPETGVGSWSGGSQIGAGWTQMKIVGGPDGRVYSIPQNGELRRLRWNGTGWDSVNGGQHEVIGTGWNRYTTPEYSNRITVDERGHFYTVEPDGNLHQWVHNETSKTWTHRIIDTGWSQYNLVVAAGNGVIWARKPDGNFYRFRYHTESQRWLQREKNLGIGWNSFSAVFSPGADIFYAVRPDTGDMFWYRYFESTDSWAGNVGKLVGQGWNRPNVLATTNTCALTTNPFPSRPAVTTRDNAPTSISEANSGLLQYFYTDTFGRLVHGRQRNTSDLTLIDYTVVAGHQSFTDMPTSVVDGNGNLHVAALGQDSATRRATQTAGSTTWTPLADFGGWTPKPATFITDTNKTITALAIDATGTLRTHNHNPATSADLGWRATNATGLTNDITTVRTGDAYEILVRTTTGELKAARYTAGTIGPWRNLGNLPGTGKTGFAINPDNTLQLFALNNGTVVTARETTGSALTWNPLPAITAQGTPIVSVSNGIIHLAVHHTDGYIYVTEQTAPASANYRPWRVLADSRTGLAFRSVTEPTAISTTNGRVVITFRDADGQPYVYQSLIPTAQRNNQQPSQETTYEGGPTTKPAN